MLFSYTYPINGNPKPVDTVGAIVAILQNPTADVSGIFSLSPAMGPFQPTLPRSPTTWVLPIVQQTPPPVFSLPSGGYTNTQMLTLTDSDTKATIYYTTDGSTPTASSYVYFRPILVDQPERIRAVAFNNSVFSTEADGLYNVSQTIIFSPPGGSYTGQTTVTMTSSLPGAQISYTTNGSDPTATSGLYNRTDHRLDLTGHQSDRERRPQCGVCQCNLHDHALHNDHHLCGQRPGGRI